MVIGGGEGFVSSGAGCKNTDNVNPETIEFKKEKVGKSRHDRTTTTIVKISLAQSHSQTSGIGRGIGIGNGIGSGTGSGTGSRSDCSESEFQHRYRALVHGADLIQVNNMLAYPSIHLLN